MGRLLSRHLHKYENINATKQVKNDELTTLTVNQLKELLETKGIEYTKNDKRRFDFKIRSCLWLSLMK